MFVLKRTYEALANDYLALKAIYENDFKASLAGLPEMDEYKFILTRKSLSNAVVAIELNKKGQVIQVASAMPNNEKAKEIKKRKSNHLRKATKKV